MGVVTQMASLPFGGHDSGIWIGRTDHEVSHAPIAAPHDLPIRFSPLLDPVMTLLIGRGQVLTERSFQGSRQLHRSHDGRGTGAGERHLCLVGCSHLFPHLLLK